MNLPISNAVESVTDNLLILFNANHYLDQKLTSSQPPCTMDCRMIWNRRFSYMTFVSKSFVVLKCKPQLSQKKNSDFKSHVNNQYEEGFVYLVHCWIKRKSNVTMPRTKRNWKLELAWKLALETLFCLLYLWCGMLHVSSHHDRLVENIYNTTAA